MTVLIGAYITFFFSLRESHKFADCVNTLRNVWFNIKNLDFSRYFDLYI